MFNLFKQTITIIVTIIWVMDFKDYDMESINSVIYPDGYLRFLFIYLFIYFFLQEGSILFKVSQLFLPGTMPFIKFLRGTSCNNKPIEITICEHGFFLVPKEENRIILGDRSMEQHAQP